MKIMLIGKTGSGKTTLTQRLNKKEVEYRKTQMISYENNIIDTPGEYLENKFYYKALLVASTEATKLVFIQEATDTTTFYPPNFRTMFNGKDIIGVITKKDLMNDTEMARKFLKNAGVEEIFEIGMEEDEAFLELKRRLGV